LGSCHQVFGRIGILPHVWKLFLWLEGGLAMKCRHCQLVPANRPRGLCWSCYYSPGIRDRYPSTSKYAHRGLDDFYGEPVAPPFPTAALPGSVEKVLVLQGRAQRGEALWHPDDGPDGKGHRCVA
jgi:hypothetical protein